MPDLAPYVPDPAFGARVEKSGEKWTLILVRDLRHTPENVWQALIDPAQLIEWAPFAVDGSLATAGAKIRLTWAGTGQTTEATVIRAAPPHLLEYGDIRWQLESTGSGTRLTLWHAIDARFITWGAAGWHICLDVLSHLLAGQPLGRLAGPDAMKLEAWQRLVKEYAHQFGSEG
jgi:hypothetical protein